MSGYMTKIAHCIQPANASCEEPVDLAAAKRPVFLNILLYDKPGNCKGSTAQWIRPELDFGETLE